MRRRVVAVLLTAALVLGSSMSVWAAGETESALETLEKVSGTVEDAKGDLSDKVRKEEAEGAAKTETKDAAADSLETKENEAESGEESVNGAETAGQQAEAAKPAVQQGEEAEEEAATAAAEPFSGVDANGLTWEFADGVLTISGNGALLGSNSPLSDEIKGEEVTSAVIKEGVTEIGEAAFKSYYKLQNVSIPNSVTKIGEHAFSECISLSALSMPDSVEEIGANAFSGSGLTAVTIPAGVTEIKDFTFDLTSLEKIEIPDNVVRIGEYAFVNCVKLSEVSLPDSLVEIGDSAFAFCEMLSAVTIPDSVQEIGERAFMYSGLSSVSISKGITEIKEATFGCCESLTGISIPGNITKIGNSAFFGSSLSSIVIPDSVTEIGHCAFYKCNNLTSVSIPSGITKINSWAFRECGNLGETRIPGSVTEIAYGAFGGCKNLPKVTIPDSVKSIGYAAFTECTGLQFVSFQGDAPAISDEAPVDEYAMGVVDIGVEPFQGVTTAAYYPTDNETYSEEIRTAYGSGLQWEAKEPLKIILETTNNTHVLGTSDTATITCSGDLKDFVSVYVDGAEVDKSNYTLAEGSTILTFTAQYLNTLNVGTHTVTMNYTYGSVDTELTILSTDSATSPSSSAGASGSAGTRGGANVSVRPATARTGDSTAALPWLFMLGVAVAIGTGTVFVRRRRSV